MENISSYFVRGGKRVVVTLTKGTGTNTTLDLCPYYTG